MAVFSERARLSRRQETDKEAFELRLWDGRIGRWLTTDPAGQYTSPYIGMGNNPINGIDPDGGKFVFPGKTKNEQRQYKRNLKGMLRNQFAKSKTFKNVWKDLKVSLKEYRFVNQRYNAEGTFVKTYAINLFTDQAENPDRAGGDIFIDPAVWDDTNLFSNVVVEELIHALQFDKSVSIHDARKFDYTGYDASFGGNREFEAKMIVGIINNESGLPYYKTPNGDPNDTEWAQRFGTYYINILSKKEDAIQEYLKGMMDWQSLLMMNGSFYGRAKFDFNRNPILIKSPRFFNKIHYHVV